MACSKCDPKLNPTGPRKHEGHLAIRFGDHTAVVRKNGIVITDCYEVEAPDRAWRYRVGPWTVKAPEELWSSIHALDIPLSNCEASVVEFCSCGSNASAYLDESGGFSVEVRGYAMNHAHEAVSARDHLQLPGVRAGQESQDGEPQL